MTFALGLLFCLAVNVSFSQHPGNGMPAEIAELTEEAEIAQADYEALLDTYEHSSGLEKIRLVSPLTSALMRRDETLFTLARALRAL